MKLLIFIVIVIELVLLYKIINLKLEPFEEKEMTDAERKLRLRQFNKDNQERNKELEKQLKNRGSNSSVKDYSKLDEDKDKDEKSDKTIEETTTTPSKKYKFRVFGDIRLKGDSTKLTEKDGDIIKNNICQLLNADKNVCNITIKRDFFISYNIDMVDVDIDDIKDKLKINKKIGDYEIIQASLPSVKDIGLIKIRKDSKHTPKPDVPRNKEADMPKYYDWTLPLSKPAACSPPQEYDNTPFIEYQLTNGTPLSFLDETTVGYILPKFYYQQY